MAIMNSCNKHNMIACVEKTERNANFHEVIDFLTGCYVNYALLVSPDVAGKNILVLEASVRTDLMFNDEDGTNCFDNQVIWDTLRDIGYEGRLATNQKFNFSKLIFDGMLRNLKDNKPFLMYPSPKFFGKLTSLTPHMLEVATAIRAEYSLHTEELDITTSSHHSADSSAGEKAESLSPVASERPASQTEEAKYLTSCLNS
ncbi:hypothetical protein Tco_0820116 [Tanacetum coccineum]|uniref:Uncharacterized protein n=1 Tax=Tanacetum coccineum TaxID=301880 RepID=A0ABQ5ABJ3_9ASTR